MILHFLVVIVGLWLAFEGCASCVSHLCRNPRKLFLLLLAAIAFLYSLGPILHISFNTESQFNEDFFKRGHNQGSKGFFFGRKKRDETLQSYKVLGLQPNASSKEIKNAFRKLSLKWHPDKNPGNEDAKEKYYKIRQAYDILKQGTKD